MAKARKTECPECGAPTKIHDWDHAARPSIACASDACFWWRFLDDDREIVEWAKAKETILCICFRWFNDGWYTSAWPLRYLGRGLEATSAGRTISNGLARAQQGTVDVWAAYVNDDDLFSIQEGRTEPPPPSQKLYFDIKKGS